ncbi:MULTISPECIES: hypothetical protein [Nocardia]|uniref:hypothetical protein n=1 Tax=Nocardia TaxID=1817 RepID=UPI00189534F1|nr:MULTISPECIES: hypothetical protein [Nocardia]MBF6349086.1 hypothetical protein [Nocardia flavorosea]
MRRTLRAGLLASALLITPVAGAATAAAVPLVPQSHPAAERAASADIGLVCTMQYPPTPLCWLSSLSASISGPSTAG